MDVFLCERTNLRLSLRHFIDYHNEPFGINNLISDVNRISKDMLLDLQLYIIKISIEMDKTMEHKCCITKININNMSCLQVFDQCNDKYGIFASGYEDIVVVL